MIFLNFSFIKKNFSKEKNIILPYYLSIRRLFHLYPEVGNPIYYLKYRNIQRALKITQYVKFSKKIFLFRKNHQYTPLYPLPTRQSLKLTPGIGRAVNFTFSKQVIILLFNFYGLDTRVSKISRQQRSFGTITLSMDVA